MRLEQVHSSGASMFRNGEEGGLALVDRVV
jgi:hypothetical protein